MPAMRRRTPPSKLRLTLFRWMPCQQPSMLWRPSELGDGRSRLNLQVKKAHQLVPILIFIFLER